MESDRTNPAPGETSDLCCRRALSRLRQAYFAYGRESAERYGISFDQVITHLWGMRHSERRFSLKSVRYLDDLVHAVACTHDLGSAWRDLSEYYERPLVRHCRHWLEEPAATVFIRRLLTEMRRSTSGAAKSPVPSLARYGGTWPLRRWLGNRVIGCLAEKSRLAESYPPPGRALRAQVTLNPGRLLDKTPEGFTLAR